MQSQTMESDTSIELSGVRVHNLKNIDVRIQRGALTVICGVSGSGKSSLAFDTLFAEGQRRYIETFSPAARQFLDRIERPAADRIEGIPPAIAVRQNSLTYNLRSTVGTRTELLDHLRLLFVRAGSIECPQCRIPVTAFTPEQAADWLLQRFSGRRTMSGFQYPSAADASQSGPTDTIGSLLAGGYTRIYAAGKIWRLDDLAACKEAPTWLTQRDFVVLLDRLLITAETEKRLTESLESAMAAGDGSCCVFCETADHGSGSGSEQESGQANTVFAVIDGTVWEQHHFSEEFRCRVCHRVFVEPAVERLNFNSPAGACTKCAGLGSVTFLALEKVVPDRHRTLREFAIQCWSPPAFHEEHAAMLSALTAAQVPLDVPFHELNVKHRKLIQSGIPRSGFSGLDGFFRGLPERKNRRGIHAFLNRWRSWMPCPECDGSRLNAEASAIRLLGKTLHEVAQLELDCLLDWIGSVSEAALAEVNSPLRPIIEHVLRKLNFLIESGLRYLSLDRPMRTLSGGEAQRVMLTTALASGLINTLYVLDEPTSGLHTADTKRIIRAVHALRDTGNTVVVVEHDPEFIAAADEVIETGPGAGEQGGAVVFQGTPRDLIHSADSATGQRLRSLIASQSPAVIRTSTRRPARSPEYWLRLTGVSCHNIRDLDVRFPLGVICAVTGVSGSGKSSLVVNSLYPAVCQAKAQFCDVENSGQVSQIEGLETIDRVLLLDQSRLPKSARSVPATWMGMFDPVRRLLAETHEGKKRNLTAASFSFNSARGGRCPVCEGLGSVTVEMQFLADIRTVCEECHGRRFRSDILEVRYRDRSVDDILEMTADTAFTFFTGQHQIQQRLNALRQAGLGYLRLGQPLSTLSGGEAQRLRIAAVLAGVPLPGSDASGAVASAGRRGGAAGNADRTLFLLDEPSTGLHMQDIDGLMNCLDYLIQTGHSVILIEHDEYLLSQVDYRIELGPGAGRDGGRIIQSGVLPARE